MTKEFGLYRNALERTVITIPIIASSNNNKSWWESVEGVLFPDLLY